MYISLNWFNGWSDTKKPIASNSLFSLSSNFQSSILDKISKSFSSGFSNKLIWLNDLLSKKFFDFCIKLGIDSKSDALFWFKLSKTPALTNPSSWSLFISLGLTLLIKSAIDLNFPLFSRSSTTFEIASNPTFLIAPSA